MTKVQKVYVAGPNGFTVAGMTWHRAVVLPALATADLTAFDPWSGPAKEWFDTAFATPEGPDRIAAVHQVNSRVGERNAELIAECDAVLANLEGVDVDSGTASEIGYACALGKPVIAFRPDMRTTGDNIGSVVNLQVEYFIAASGGAIVADLDSAIEALVGLRIE